MNSLKKIILFFFTIILTAIIIRLFIGLPAKISSGSMEPTISTGDWVWINKCSYGAIVPQKFSDIPLLNIFTNIPLFNKIDSKVDWGYHRLFRFKEPQISDIVVFKNPKDSGRTLLVKRISAIYPNKQYYVLGDNSPVSEDSRSFGSISEKDIVGKIGILIFSTDTSYRVRSNRFLKKIQ